MPVTPDKPGPYAPASTILQVIERHRSRGLPTPINAEVLGRAGVSDSLQPRVLQALQTLDLVTDAGEITQTFERIQRAPESEYQQRLREWLNSAYADVLRFIDPATATEIQVRDAFRSYNPVGQQPRMVTLFISLYAAAGVRSERTSAPRIAQNAKPRSANKFIRPVQSRTAGQKAAPSMSTDFPPMVAALLKELPAQGNSWTSAQRDKFLKMFATILDYSYAVVEEAPHTDETEDDE